MLKAFEDLPPNALGEFRREAAKLGVPPEVLAWVVFKERQGVVLLLNGDGFIRAVRLGRPKLSIRAISDDAPLEFDPSFSRHCDR